MSGARAGLLTLLALASCAKPTAPPHAPEAAKAALWSYEVVVNGGELDVVATFDTGALPTLTLDEPAVPFVASVESAAAGGAWAAVTPRSGVWTVPSCAHGCTVRYRFHLAEAGRTLGDVDTVLPFEGGFEAPPSSWLLRPSEAAGPTTYRFHVKTTGDAHFATGVRPIAGSPDTYGAGAEDLDFAPYTVFGDFGSRTLHVKDAVIEVATLHARKLALDDAAIDRWIDLSARSIIAYYGRFPVSRVLLLIAPMSSSGHETAEGRTLASGGSSILLLVSPSMTADDIPSDWVLTHEMTHLALPDQRREHRWIEEGSATYVEPIARAQVGTIKPEEVWRGLIDGLPNGEPEDGDEGLDRTHSWGRTYWGGALFCLVADVEIRKRTGNKKGLEDALKGIVAVGGNGETRWPLEEVLRRGDVAVGVPVLEELHARWGTAAVKVDLPKLWGELGVRADGKSVVFDDNAPLSAIRRAITMPGLG